MATPVEILKKYWGFPTFKNQQETIINSILAGKDTLGLLPTGGGKSITFQIAGLSKEGICLVISPLISLMNDQVNRLNSLGIKAVSFSGKLAFNEQLRILENGIYGAYKFLYISPERLQSDLFQLKLHELNINLIAVDEAHCISEWGHDFRPSYRKIATIREQLPNIPILALTATATPKVVNDICTQLQFKNHTIVKQSFERKNLTYTVAKINDKITALERLFNKDKSASIIYVRSRYLCNEISEQLSYLGFKTSIYNAGLSLEERAENFRKWSNGKAQIMIATNAFGMGIDKADVRWVIHFNIPESIESYFQEAGRAGRDGKASNALLLYTKADLDLVKNQFLDTIPDIPFIKKVYRKLCTHFQLAYNEKKEQFQDFEFYAFCEKYNFKKKLTFNTLRLLHREGIIGLSENFGNRSSIQFSINNKDLLSYTARAKKHEAILHFLLRNNGGAFESFTQINEYEIAQYLAISKNEIIKQLQDLSKENILIYNNTNTNFSISFLHIREDDRTINRIKQNTLSIQKQKKLKVYKMLDFVQQKEQCSSQYLLNYFGEKTTQNCGKCNNCKQTQRLTKNSYETISLAILALLKQKEKSATEIINLLRKFDSNLVLETIQQLVVQGFIKANKYNQYYHNLP